MRIRQIERMRFVTDATWEEKKKKRKKKKIGYIIQTHVLVCTIMVQGRSWSWSVCMEKLLLESDGLCKTAHRYRLTIAFTLCICINPYYVGNKKQGRGSLDPVVQSIVRLTSSLVDKMLTILISRISNSQIFLLKNMWVAFANAKATHIFQQKILVYMPY